MLHIAERHAGLLPGDAKGRAGATSWMFAALNTLEPPLVEREVAMRGERDQPWYEKRLPMVEARARRPLGELSRYLGEAEWLDGRFTAGDLLMAAVLFRAPGAVAEFPNLVTYVAHAQARPAFQRACAAQLAVFTASQASA